MMNCNLIGRFLMSEYIISGGRPLVGHVRVDGAKNSVLPILCACLLCDEGFVTLSNCPRITDVQYTLEILNLFGCETSFADGQIHVNSENARFCGIPCDLVGRMRSAALFLGAALGRFHRAEQCRPGGCELGSRPIDLHLSAFSKMGLSVSDTGMEVNCSGCPHGADIFLRYPSVGATENIMLAACRGKGTVTVTNAAREPEIEDLQNFINSMGGKIRGAGSGIIIIEGVEKLHGVDYNIIGDRIEAATYLAAAIATDGEITVSGVCPSHLTAVTDLIVNSGGSVCRKHDSITASRGGQFILSPGKVETSPYPGFPTDAQSLIMAMLLRAAGTTEIHEGVFDDRLRVSFEFIKMGADITVSGRTAYVHGTERLYGARVFAGDLRSGAALVIAALSAQGESVVKNISHIERGYNGFETKLRGLGGNIIKLKD